jgi:hypothetical protein
LEISAPTPGKHYHYRGRYCIVTQWDGSAWVYDVFLNSGNVVATGFDLLSGNEQTAVEAVVDRLNGKRNGR